jgi:intracellular sulfur oxidation DsrE/DsrF family protein
MKPTQKFSAEDINAYIDGELDYEERARILIAEQHDEALARKINEVRILKAQVQLAYPLLEGHESKCGDSLLSRLIGGIRGLAAVSALLAVALLIFLSIDDRAGIQLAGQLMENARPVAAHDIQGTIGTQHRVIVHISQYRPEQFDDTLNRLERLLMDNHRNASFQVELVANEQGLDALDRRHSRHAAAISRLAERFSNLSVVACALSIAQHAEAGEPVALVDSVMIAPSAAERIAQRAGAGWLYLKI